MSTYDIKILKAYNTSIGFVGTFLFPPKLFPKIGMVIENEKGYQWEIIGTGFNKKFRFLDEFKESKENDQYWDCTIRPVNHELAMQLNEVFQIVTRSADSSKL